MADIQIALVLAGNNCEQLPLEDANFLGTPQVLTLSGTSQQSTAVSADYDGHIRAGRLFWRLCAYGTTNFFAAVGTSPTASSTAGIAFPYGQVHHFPVRVSAEKVAVIQTS